MSAQVIPFPLRRASMLSDAEARMGSEWWAKQDEQSRAYWLRQAQHGPGDPVSPADAWAAFFAPLRRLVVDNTREVSQ